MNYLGFISWGMYGGATASQRAHFFVSWGMMLSLPGVIASLIVIAMNYYRRLRIV